MKKIILFGLLVCSFNAYSCGDLASLSDKQLEDESSSLKRQIIAEPVEACGSILAGSCLTGMFSLLFTLYVPAQEAKEVCLSTLALGGTATAGLVCLKCGICLCAKAIHCKSVNDEIKRRELLPPKKQKME